MGLRTHHLRLAKQIPGMQISWRLYNATVTVENY
jgi:hypothetical protein